MVMVVEPIIYFAAPPQGTNNYSMLIWLSSFNVASNPKGSMDVNPIII
jgi:hypothetical protein